MKLTLNHIATIQYMEKDTLSFTYLWDSISDKPEAELKKVWINFKKPSPDLWAYLMTQEFDNFEVAITGTRNKAHDSLDDCYVEKLDKVNTERVKIGLSKVNA